MAKSKAPSIAGFVFKCIWLTFALVMWIIGLVIFLQNLNSDFFAGWFIFGALCIVPILGDVLPLVFWVGVSGAIESAFRFDIEVTETSVTATNHPVRGFILGLIGGIIGALLIGPVWLLVRIIIYVITTVKYAIFLFGSRV